MDFHGYDVTAVSTGVEKRTDKPEMDKYAFHYQVIVKVNGKPVYTGPYSVGSGIVAQWLKSKYPKRYQGMFAHRRTMADVDVFNMIHNRIMRNLPDTPLFPTYYPKSLDILESLFSDASGIDAFVLFKDWATCSGYDPDSIRANKIFETCKDIAMRLRQVFSADYEMIEEKIQDR